MDEGINGCLDGWMDEALILNVSLLQDLRAGFLTPPIFSLFYMDVGHSTELMAVHFYFSCLRHRRQQGGGSWGSCEREERRTGGGR